MASSGSLSPSRALNGTTSSFNGTMPHSPSGMPQAGVTSLMDIANALAEFEIFLEDPRQAVNAPASLPLEAFDQAVISDKRTLLGIPSANEKAPASFRAPKVLAYRREQNGAGAMFIGSVFSKRKAGKQLLVEFDDTREQVWVPRALVCFRKEPALTFAARLAKCLSDRALAEAHLRLNLYVDNMPVDEVPDMSSEQQHRIVTNACNTVATTDWGDHPATINLMEEVKAEFARAVNTAVFNEHRVSEQHRFRFEHLNLPPPAEKQPVPEQGMVPMPSYEFGELRDTVANNGAGMHGAAVAALQGVRAECQRILTAGLFQTDVAKTTKLLEFKRLQNEATKHTAQNLKRGRSEALRVAVVSALEGCDDPGLDITVQDKATYESSKLFHLLVRVNAMLADTLRDMTISSLSQYADYIEDLSAFNVQVNDFDDIVSMYDNPRMPGLTGRRPAFGVDLSVENGELKWSTDPDEFATALEADIVDAVGQLHDVPQLENTVVTKVFLGRRRVLASVSEDDPAVDQAKLRIREAINKAVGPMREFANKLGSFQDLIVMDVDKYVEDYKEKERTLAMDRKEVQGILDRKKLVDSQFPAAVVLGMVSVQLGSIRDILLQKLSSMARRVMNLVAEQMAVKGELVDSVYNQMSEQTAKKPGNVEELAETREFIASIPKETVDANEAIDEVLGYAAMLEELEYEMSDELFATRWRAFGWPGKLAGIIEAAETEHVRIEDAYKQEMISEQEAFAQEVTDCEAVINDFNKHADINQVASIADEVRRVQGQLKQFEESSRLFNSREGLFGLESTDYDRLGRMNRAFEPYVMLWISSDNWLKWYDEWMHGSFADLDAEKLEKDLTAAWRNVFKSSKTFADVPGLLDVANAIKEQMDDFKPHVELITSLRQPGLRERHWKQMSDELGFSVQPGESLNTLQDVFDMNLPDKQEIVNKICDVAGKEFSIESALDKMQGEWKDLDFQLVAYRESGTFVLKGSDEIQQVLDDNIVMTQAMAFSPFKKPHEERLKNWEQKLSLMSEILDAWLACQKNWMYLEPIFSSEDIMRQLPTEGQRFRSVDRQWRKWMGLAEATPHALTFTDSEGLLESLQGCNVTLEQVQKGLNDYLETKRQAFARFYFLSNDELLEILSQTRDPRAVQPHLKKCFEAIHKVQFQDDNKMTSMFSGEGEEVPWVSGVYPEGSVEMWLGDVEKMMIQSIRQQIIDCCEAYTKGPRPEWVLNWPGQVVLAGDQIYWTEETTQAIKDHKLKEYKDQCHQQLLDVTELVRRDLTKMARITLGALVTIDVHARDVIQTMVEQGVNSENDFEWIAQLRYYMQDGDTMIQQVENRFQYGYEYLGNSMRLVITPLTDRIYLTLTGALALHLGGAPAGPAGTGKTETVKDLAKAMSKQCVVFNCQEGLDYIAMGKFFKGLAMAGAWACFDEFNRIDIEVLSVIAQQLLTIQQAIIQGMKRFVFEGVEISLDPSNASFITMNPGYAGRTELPDNLKALFRPVACMVPDYALIGEIRLFSFGFRDARALAQKMVATFKLSSEQLSSQDHYDFGMRAVNTVIAAAGLLKQQSPEMDEELLLLRALKDSNLPKFLQDDIVLFNGIISDLFPGVNMPDPDYGNLKTYLMSSCKELGYQTVDNFIVKCIQLYDVTVLRHGLMMVGPTGGGKSAALKTLEHALTQLKKDKDEQYEVKTLICNPKAITMGQLYGQFDDATHEWTDGILSTLFRNAVYDTKERQKWVIFDGPVDALWIESMNTVLDDNKKLCLVSGEIISMTSWMRMIFEVEDLAVASPATVSRCGMIYMEPKGCVGIPALVTSWLQTLPETAASAKIQLQGLCDKHLDAAVEHVRRRLREYVPTVDPNLVDSFFAMFDGYFKKMIRVDGVEPDTDFEESVLKNIEPLFWMCLVWSVGGALDKSSREAFDSWVRERRGDVKAGSFQKDLSVFQVQFDLQQGKFVDWTKTVPATTINPKLNFSELIVPTADSICYSWIIEHIMSIRRHVLCVGPTGTGKTLVIKEKLSKTMPDQFLPLFITFSAQTSANQTQDILDGRMDKRRKGVFGPLAGKVYSIFIDDLNMPAREKYFAQPPIELLRQWMDHSGWYDRKALVYRQIVDCCFVGAMGPPGGGRNPVTNRFLRHFLHVSFPEMSNESLARIFNTILGAHMKEFFPSPVHDLVEGIVSASLNVYNTCLAELLPTPAKSHYTFNLRDIAKVFQGIMMADPKRIQDDRGVLMRLWLHENHRIFRDRLINMDDRLWFDKLCQDQFATCFKSPFEKIVTSERVMFGDFMVPGADPRLYAEITDMDQMRKTVEGYLEDYNAQTNKPQKLVMFLDAIEHVSRVTRVIRQPKGNILLLGVGGSGRQSLTRLAAYMSEMDCKQIEIAKGYGKNEWRDDMKGTILKAGAEGKKVVFLFSDTQIVQESFLEDINNVLNSGEIPNCWDLNDQDIIFNAVRPVCQAKGLPVTKFSVHEMFLTRVMENLHMSLAFSPIGGAFRDRLRQFPSLVNCCTIDWFLPWPDEALKGVASEAFNDVDLGDQTVTDGIIAMCRDVHQSVEAKSDLYREELRRHNYVTPTSYLELLTTFKKLVGEKRTELGTAKRRLVIGLDKLESTEKEVAQLKIDLTELQPVLEQTSIEVEEMMVVITKDKESAAETKEVVVKEEAAASAKAAECTAIKTDAEADLAEALPALDEAVKVLKNLKQSDISEVAKYSNPPALVKLVVEGICIMREIAPAKVGEAGKKVDDFWVPGKKMLGDPKGLLDAMFGYDKDNIPEKVIKKIQPIIDNPDFDPKKIESVSKACTAMCQWVQAMHKYHFVAKNVEPKRQKLAAAEAELKEVMERLSGWQAKLKEVEDRLADLESKFDAAVKKKDELSKQSEDCTVKLDRAGRLLGGLGGEKVRWQETVASLGAAEINVVGDVMVAAGGIAYLGAFTASYRSDLEAEWRKKLLSYKVSHSDGAGVRATLADPVQIRNWTIYGLPTDGLSLENAIIMSKSRRWPLMIDPQGQANKWIKNMEKERNLDVIKLSDKEFLRSLVNGVRFGKPVLLENIGEELDPSLEPVLLKQTFKQGGSEMIKIGDDTIPYHPDFLFYITTKLPNPHYQPETCVKVTLLNFTVNPEGLEDQLLGIVVSKERPDLQEMKNQLVVQNAKMKNQLKAIEDDILRLLAESEGNILDDETLINTLAEAKTTSAEINEKVAEAEKTEKEIDTTREKYRPVAYRGSILFFAVADMGAVDPMYQFSLQWFIDLFERAIDDSEAAEEVEKRCVNLNDFFTYSLYKNICRGLFEKHKLLFSFTLCIKLLQGDNLVDPEEWRFLLVGASVNSAPVPNPAPEWLVERSWVDLCALSELPRFKGLSDSFAANVPEWRKYFDSNTCHSDALPGEWNEKLDSFARMLVLRCLRVDKVIEAIQLFVSEKIGEKFIDPPTFNLAAAFEDSTPISPLVFVLTAGADPVSSLIKFAEDQGFSSKLGSISLGQGQGPIAEKLINEAIKEGTWVLLQNCHLAVSWMSTLERIVENLKPEEVNPDFRMWLSCMPSPHFPVSVLQNSVKMTIEPPKGLRQNLLRSYADYDDEFLDGCQKPDAFKKLLYGTCFFHAVVQERRKFGPLGWNIAYDFTAGDMNCCVSQLKQFLDKYEEVPYKVITFLSGHINYGGRVTDDWDRRTLLTLLSTFVCPEMLTDEYSFSPSGQYTSLPAGSKKEAEDFIRALPINPAPEVFGLHENADITCAQNEVNELFELVLGLQPRSSAGAGKSREEVISDSAKEIESQVPKVFDFIDIQRAYPVKYEESMNTVLQQEVIRYNKLLAVIARSLKELQKALVGLVVMSGELESMANSLFINQVPESWADKAYPSLKPLSAWVEDLCKRIDFIQKWIDGGIPPAFWISGFFFPQAFLTGTLQNYARKYQISIATASFNFIVVDKTPEELTEKPEDGCYIFGLFVEGARWGSEDKSLVESRPKELYTTMAPIWLKPEQDRKKPESGIFMCPCYKILTRKGTLSTTGHSTNFVLTIEMPSNQAEEHWTRRGVALFCSLAY